MPLGEAIPIIREPAHALAVSPAMLKAGRRAFMKHRRTLDDLFCFYETDLADFLREIFCAMRSAGERQ